MSKIKKNAKSNNKGTNSAKSTQNINRAENNDHKSMTDNKQDHMSDRTDNKCE